MFILCKNFSKTKNALDSPISLDNINLLNK
jgi:hypothetical protein